MLKSFKTLFKVNQEKQEPSEQQLKLAAATLMFEVIRSDGQVDPIELQQMGRILRQEFGLNDDELDELFEQAEKAAHEAISLQGFTREICDNWGNEQRTELLKHLWILAFADEQIDDNERHLVRKVAGLLYLNDAEVQRAREAAKRHLAIK